MTPTAKLLKCLLLSIALLAPSVVQAKPCYDECRTSCGQFFVLAGAGGSFSRNACIQVDNRFWDAAPQGYNSGLGSSELWSEGLGYKFNEFLTITAEFTARPSFSYCKFQSPATGEEISFFGNKTRKFNLRNQSVLFNAYLFGGGLGDRGIALVRGATCIQPFFAAGIGVAYNRIDNFHSVITNQTVDSSGLILNVVGSAMTSSLSKSFAWQLMAGIELLHNDTWAIDIGYRYFSVNKFKTNSWVFAVESPAATNAVTAPAWCGQLRADEFFVNIKAFIW